MPFIVNNSQPNNPKTLLPPGTYLACIVKVNSVPNHFYPGQRTAQFVFEVIGTAKTTRLNAEINPFVRNDSKLVRWVQAISGEDLRPGGNPFDLESLVGKKCRIQISHKESAKGTPYVKVEDVSPTE